MCSPNGHHYHHHHNDEQSNNGSQNGNIDLNMDLMLDTQIAADKNQARFDDAGIYCFNLMSSPGTGKTTLLEQTLARMQGSQHAAVIEGDMTTELDAERLRAFDVPVIAVTTGRACHLDAELVSKAIEALDLASLDIVFIENVGNLVCPAEFPLGAHQNVVLISVTEGDDKPLKYPVMFYEADCVVITKTDLAPYVRADVDKLAKNVHQIRPGIPIFALSAETGDGIEPWIEWLRDSSKKPVITELEMA